MRYKIFIAISVIILTISVTISIILQPELLYRLNLMSTIPDKIDLEKLEAAKEVLKNCKISQSEHERMMDVIFQAEKEIKLNDDSVKAATIYKTIIDKILACHFRPDGDAAFLDTLLGRINTIVQIISGLSIILFSYLHHRNKLSKA